MVLRTPTVLARELRELLEVAAPDHNDAVVLLINYAEFVRLLTQAANRLELIGLSGS